MSETEFKPESVSAFMAASGLRLTSVGAERVEGYIDLGPEHHQPDGIVHGGVYSSAVETVASVGAWMAVADKGQIVVGVHNGTDFLRAMRQGRVRVVGEPIRVGATQQLWEVRITDEQDRLVASGRVRLANLTPRPEQP